MNAEKFIQRLCLVLVTLYFGVSLAGPLTALVVSSLQSGDDGSAANLAGRLTDPRLVRAAGNSLWVGALTSAITTALALFYAYGLTRARLPLKGIFAAAGQIPLLAPSLLSALALVYLFGVQGLLRPWMGEASIMGWQGIVIANVIATFPHALLVLRTALSASDGRLYEAGELMGRSGRSMFLAVTLPGVRHGLVSAALIVFMLTIADIGAPKVVGGSFDVLALEIYKQVLGQQDFAMGAAVALAMLAPTALAMGIERWAASRQSAALSARSTPLVLKPHLARDTAMLTGCSIIAAGLVGVIAVCQFASVAAFWPYDVSFTTKHYDFNRFDGGGWQALGNSVQLAVFTAIGGALLVFANAYLLEKTKPHRVVRGALSGFSLLSAAVPGLSLGLAYVFFFNNPANLLNGLYGTMAILVLATITHFYTVAHLSATSALKALDPEFETAAAAMGRPFWMVAARVSFPISIPALIETALYFFVNAMTTVSVVVFLYGPHTKLASVAVLNMDDAGDVAPAAAMGMMIFYINLAVRIAGETVLTRVRASTTRGKVS